MVRYKITLTEEERKDLKSITSKGKHRSQKLINALILLNCDEGGFQTKRSTNEQVAGVLKISMKKLFGLKNVLWKKALMLLSMVIKGNVFMKKKRTGILKPIWLR